MTKTPTGAAKRRITIERTYNARDRGCVGHVDDQGRHRVVVGSGGFTVKVRTLDLRPGGELHYAMTAIAAPQIEFMTKAGMKLTTEARLTYTEVTAPTRLAYPHLAEFIPGVEPYGVATVVELHPVAGGVRLVLIFDAMHDEQWTQRAVMGWESELGKLSKVLTK